MAYIMYVCPDCRKVFKVAGNGKRAKCNKCPDSLLIDMNITDDDWRSYDAGKRTEIISNLLDEPEIIEAEDETDDSAGTKDSPYSFFDYNDNAADTHKSSQQYGSPTAQTQYPVNSYNNTDKGKQRNNTAHRSYISEDITYTPTKMGTPRPEKNVYVTKPDHESYNPSYSTESIKDKIDDFCQSKEDLLPYFSLFIGVIACFTAAKFIGLLFGFVSIWLAYRYYRESGRVTAPAIIGVLFSALGILVLVVSLSIKSSKNTEATKEVTAKTEITKEAPAVKVNETPTESAPTPVPSEGIWAVSPTSISNFEYDLNPYDKEVSIKEYKGTDKKLWIPATYTLDGETYTTILDSYGIFSHDDDIESIILADGIEKISSSCFNSCDELEYLYIPESVRKSGADSIFNYSSKYKEVYFGGNDTLWYAYVKDVRNDNLKYMPVYVNSHIGSSGIEKGTLYDKAKVVEAEIPSEEEESDTIISADDFIASATAVTYEELRRYPEKYKGKAISLKIKVKEVEPDGWIFQKGMLAVIPGTSSELIVYDGRKIREPRIMKGDTVKIYALGNGLGVIKQQTTNTIIPKTVDKYEVPQVTIMKVENDSNTTVDTSIDGFFNTSSEATEEREEKAREAGENAADAINKLIE